MATSQAKSKSAMDTLLVSMDELVDSAAKRMTPDELRKARKEINNVNAKPYAAGTGERRFLR